MGLPPRLCLEVRQGQRTPPIPHTGSTGQTCDCHLQLPAAGQVAIADRIGERDQIPKIKHNGQVKPRTYDVGDSQSESLGHSAGDIPRVHNQSRSRPRAAALHCHVDWRQRINPRRKRQLP